MVQGSSVGWLPDSNTLAVKSTTGMGNVPSSVEVICDGPPFCWGGWTDDQLTVLFFNNGLANFWDEGTDGVTDHSEVIL